MRAARTNANNKNSTLPFCRPFFDGVLPRTVDSHRQGGSVECLLMKRFTETTKWQDPWFMHLPPDLKLLWLYLCDSCDNAGVIDLDFGLASFLLSLPITQESLTKLGDRVERLENGKLWIPQFVKFQFGKLTPDSRVHQSIFKTLESHGLSTLFSFEQNEFTRKRMTEKFRNEVL